MKKIKEKKKQIIAVGVKESAECYDVSIIRVNGQKMAIKVVLRAKADDTLFFCITDKPMAPLSQNEKIEVENAVLWSIKNSRVSPFSFPIPESVRLATLGQLGGR